MKAVTPPPAARQAARLANNPDLANMSDAQLLEVVVQLAEDISRYSRINRTHRSARRSPAQAARQERHLAAVLILRSRDYMI